jgi:lysophospholipase L1-like esterase
MPDGAMTGEFIPSRRVRIVGALLMTAVASLVGLLLAEVGLRLFWPQVFPVHPPGMYTEAPWGTSLTPGFSGRLQRTDFDAPFNVNDLGLRGSALPPRTDSTVRVVALGDSQTFGFGVTDDSTFSVQLERILNAAYPARDVQVVNAGTPGYGTYHQLALLRARWDTLHPDIVLLQFLPVNDFEENRFAVEKRAPEVRDGMLTRASADDAPRESWASRLEGAKRRSHLLHLVSETAGGLAMRLGLMGSMAGMVGEDFSTSDSVLTDGLLREVAQFARERGAQVLFLYSTGKHDMTNSYAPPRSRAVLAAAAQGAGAEWIELNDRMLQRPSPRQFYFGQDGHWSPMGHQVVAELVAERLSSLGWLSAPSR